MDRKTTERIISIDRLEPYLKRNGQDFDKAVEHYKANIRLSESFYPLISILEIGLRNSINEQLTRKFKTMDWFENHEFIKIASSFQITKISEARSSILRGKKEITSGRIISELSFGFGTSFFDTRYEMTLWKNLRLAFPNCPKNIRRRKNISSKLNGIRKFRNRIFHQEAIAWNMDAIETYKDELIEGIVWINKDLPAWCNDIFRINSVIEAERGIIEK